MNGEPAAKAIVRKNEKVQSVLIREPGNLLRQNDEISSEESNSSELGAGRTMLMNAFRRNSGSFFICTSFAAGLQMLLFSYQCSGRSEDLKRPTTYIRK